MELELYAQRSDEALRLHQAPVRTRVTPSDKISLEWLGDGHVMGVYGSDQILELRDGSVRTDLRKPTKDLIGGIPLDLMTVVARERGELAATGHEGSLWAAPEPAGPWRELRGTVASWVGIAAVGLVPLGQGWVVADLHSGAACVHDSAGLCFDGVMERVYVTAAGRVGDRVLAGGFGQLGVVERTWR